MALPHGLDDGGVHRMGRRPGDGTRTAEDLPHDDLRPDGSLGGIVLREDAVMRKARQEV